MRYVFCRLRSPSRRKKTNIGKWAYFIIQDLSLLDANHPIHLHGHDFYVLAQGSGNFSGGITPLNLNNPPRRDTAILPGNGYLVIGIYTDNPGYVNDPHLQLIQHANHWMGTEHGSCIVISFCMLLKDFLFSSWKESRRSRQSSRIRRR